MAGLPLQIRMEMAILNMGLNSINRTILELRLNENFCNVHFDPINRTILELRLIKKSTTLIKRPSIEPFWN